MKKKDDSSQTFANVWDAIADSPEEAASLNLRYEMMEGIREIVEHHGWTQAEAAAKCGVTQPRMNDLLRGRIARFSLDALVDIATALGQKVTMKLNAA